MNNSVTKENEIHRTKVAALGNSNLTNQKQKKLYLVTKRVIDILGALFGLILVSPIFIVISLLYLFGENKGPVFFGQKRVGQHGRMFRMYKFRSMIVNAEQVLKSDKILFNKYLNNNYKLDPVEDPRITKLGQFLRKTSLDELPQLLNVLKGDMTLVGPRPVIEEELKEYNHRLSDFLNVKPGVTGYWQICGRSDVGYPERTNLEFYYIDNQGALFDMKIILKTILLVVSRKGAY